MLAINCGELRLASVATLFFQLSKANENDQWQYYFSVFAWRSLISTETQTHKHTHTFIKTKASNAKKTGVLKTHAHT